MENEYERMLQAFVEATGAAVEIDWKNIAAISIKPVYTGGSDVDVTHVHPQKNAGKFVVAEVSHLRC